MKNNTHEQEVVHEDSNVAGSALAGLLIGGLAGAGAALLLAPQSGKETREQIQQKTIEIRDRTAETVESAVSQVKAKTIDLRDRTTEKVEDAVSQVKSKTHEITSNLHGKAEELQHQGQELIAEQLDRVSAAAEAGKVALTHEHEPEKKAGTNHH
jgi:gas vesicle protein